MQPNGGCEALLADPVTANGSPAAVTIGEGTGAESPTLKHGKGPVGL